MLLLLLLIPLLADAYEEEGWASWYGGKFHGRTTASGEVFDTHKMTAAHKTLPFGTQVKVTSKYNGKTVVVKINDRGPFVEGRIIDLSMAAAEKIGMIGQGIAPVKIETLSPLQDVRNEPVIIQAAAFREKKYGLRAMKILEENNYSPVMQHADPGLYRIFIPALKKTAEEIIQDLEPLGFPGAFIRH